MTLGDHHPRLIRIHLDHITLLDRSVAAVEDEIEAALDAIPAAWGVDRRRRPVRRTPARAPPCCPPRSGSRRSPASASTSPGDHRRDRPGHDPVPDRRPPGVLGRARPRRPPVRPPVPQAEEGTGRRLPEGLLHPGRQRRRADRAPSSASGSAACPRRIGGDQGQVRRRPLHPRHHLAPPRQTPRPGSPTSAPTGTTRKTDRDRKIRSHLRQLQALGLDVTITPAAA